MTTGHKPLARPTELRYRVADFINDRLKAIPYLHAAARSILLAFTRHRFSPGAAGVVKPSPVQASAAIRDTDSPLPESQKRSEEVRDLRGRLDLLPFPPLEMRELVGPTELEAFDNPKRELVYPWLPEDVYERVFDFGCGCGRVARQLILQNPSPKEYVGVDLHAGMIRWCQANLQPVAPNFRFFHHNVFNTRFNPGPDKPSTLPFPVPDSHFTLVNALSVFTHLTQDQAVHYLQECARVLHPEGLLHASWFLFDKSDFPMLHEINNALYVSYIDPSAAVIFDRHWVRNTAREIGLTICRIIPPQFRGHQWLLIMIPKSAVPEVDFPPDTAPRACVPPPMGSAKDPAKIGLEIDES
jgi:SAM-dependent methyltransferase